MSRALTWFFWNAAFAAVMYLGFELGNIGAHHLFVFWIWFKFISSFLAHNDMIKQHYIAKGKPSVPKWLNDATDGAAVVFLAWHGEYLFATLFVIHYLNLNALTVALKEHLETNKP